MQFDICLPDDWRSLYEHQPFLVGHNLHESASFSTAALQALSRRIPRRQIELNAGDVPTSCPAGKSAHPRLSAAEYIGDIASHQVWVGLLRLADDPEYGPILSQLLEPIDHLLTEIDPGMSQIDGFVFVTSPNSMVPFHMDPEHNFLLQISGRKQFVIFDKHDSEVVNDELLEWFYSQDNRKMDLPQHLLERGRSIVLEPGQGLHVPICAPHFVRTQDEPSVSLSITYATPRWDRREAVYRVNRRLRRIGLRPSPPGSQWDPIKAGSNQTWSNVKKHLSMARA